MKVDEDGILVVTAEDKRGQNTASLTITAEKLNLSEQEIFELQMLKI